MPVAAWYGFRFAGIESYYQSGRDPEWDRHAVGAGILEHSIRQAFADGMQRVPVAARRRELQAALRQLGPQSVVTVALAGSARGRALVAGVETAGGTPPRPPASRATRPLSLSS